MKKILTLLIVLASATTFGQLNDADEAVMALNVDKVDNELRFTVDLKQQTGKNYYLLVKHKGNRGNLTVDEKSVKAKKDGEEAKIELTEKDMPEENITYKLICISENEVKVLAEWDFNHSDLALTLKPEYRNGNKEFVYAAK